MLRARNARVTEICFASQRFGSRAREKYRETFAQPLPLSGHRNRERHAGIQKKDEGIPMSPSELFAIRTRLRTVNVEFSALVKDKSGDGRFLRMRELKAERAELMALLAGDGISGLSAGLRIVREPLMEPASRLAT
jgi:hypothetical protein